MLRVDATLPIDQDKLGSGFRQCRHARRSTVDARHHPSDLDDRVRRCIGRINETDPQIVVRQRTRRERLRCDPIKDTQARDHARIEDISSRWLDSLDRGNPRWGFRP